MLGSRDVIDLLVDLIRFDTTNWGGGRAHGERMAAEWLASELQMVGLEPVIVAHPDAPARSNVIARMKGRDPSLPAVLIHGHLDVVPADAAHWSVPPFEGIIKDGWIYGRGAMDMKDFCAMMLACALDIGHRGVMPQRDIVFAWVADEEDMGVYGAQWLVREHPELFKGCEVAIGEDGAVWTPVATVDGNTVHLYPVACAERAGISIEVVARGEAGHGSRPSPDDALHRLIESLHRIVSHEWPLNLSPVVREQLVATARAVGLPMDTSSESDVAALIDFLGDAAGALRYTVRTSTTPTVVNAGYKSNVIPQQAHATLDVRCPPGFESASISQLNSLIGPHVEWDFIHRYDGVESSFDNYWFAAMAEALQRHDPRAVVVPMCMGGGTDAKAFATLGMQCYGFTPVLQDDKGRRPMNIHADDERNSVEGIRAGQRVLLDLIETL